MPVNFNIRSFLISMLFSGSVFITVAKKPLNKISNKTKIFVDENAPNYIPKLYFTDLQSIQNKKTQYILKSKIASEIVYAILVDRKTIDPVEIVQYMYDRYNHLQVCEKAIIYTILKLANDPSNKNIILDLQKKMNTSFSNSKYNWLGTFILSWYFMLDISDNPLENYEAIQETIECVVTKEEIFNDNRKYKTLIFFIAQYYLCEYLLKMTTYAFQARRYNEVIVYCRRILVRYKMHPMAAVEALFYLLEVMLILDFKELAIFYKESLETLIKANKLLQKKKTNLRLKYLLQIYSFV